MTSLVSHYQSVKRYITSTFRQSGNMLPVEAANKTLAANLKDLLEACPTKLPRPEMAARMKIGDKTLGFLKAGTGNPTLESISLVAKFFHRQPWELLKPKGAGSSAEAPAIDVALLNRALETALAQFHAHGWMPATHQIAAAAGFVYQHVQQGQSWKAAEQAVGDLLKRHGSGAFMPSR